MKLLGSTNKDADKIKDRENVPKLESVETVLVHCIKRLSAHIKSLFTFVPNKQFGQLKNFFPHSLTMMNTVNMMNAVNTGLSFVEVWFTYQASKALEIEGNVNLTLIIGYIL